MATPMIPGSKLTDIWGRKFCFRIGLLVYGAGALVAAVQKDPSQSLVFHLRDDHERHFLNRGESSDDVREMTGQRKLVLVLFGLAFLIIIVSVIPWKDLGITFIPTLGWWSRS
jgi:uncharacterized ion transporter superfamily protein YfcC